MIPKNTVIISIVTAVVGQIVAWAPNLASREQLIISTGSFVLSAVFALASALHLFGLRGVAVPAPEGQKPAA